MPGAKVDKSGALTFAQLSPPGEGGIGVLALWGPGAAALVEGRVIHPRRGASPSLRRGRLSYGFFHSAVGEPLDEVIVACVTRDHVEINCHGGALPTRRIARDLEAAGACPVAVRVPPPRLKRTPIEAQAYEALFRASTQLAARVLAAQAGGALDRELSRIGTLLECDPPDIANASVALERLADTAPIGLAFANPPLVAVVGPANAGKSTLVNAIAGSQRTIVTDVPGTTRDAVKVPAALFGVPVVLVDTAGEAAVRTSLDEKARGRAAAAFESADAVLVVVDASVPLGGYRIPRTARPLVVAANKADLPSDAGTLAALVAGERTVVETSALRGGAVETVARALLAALGLAAPSKDVAAGPVVFTRRLADTVGEAAAALASSDAVAAREALARRLRGG